MPLESLNSFCLLEELCSPCGGCIDGSPDPCAIPISPKEYWRQDAPSVSSPNPASPPEGWPSSPAPSSPPGGWGGTAAWSAGATSELELQMGCAVMEAAATGSISPLVKEELKWKIQQRRRHRQLGGPVDTRQQNVAEDEERRSRRREQNRVAARKFREKKRQQMQVVIDDQQRLQDRVSELEDQVLHLESRNNNLERTLDMHKSTCLMDLWSVQDSSTCVNNSMMHSAAGMHL